VAVLVAIPMALVLSGRYALRVKEMRRKPGKAWSRLSWRRLASWFLAASIVALAFAVFADNQYGRPHPALLTARWLQAVLVAGYLALLFAQDHYAKQVSRSRTPPQAHTPAGIH
jgi:hypothetical protein